MFSDYKSHEVDKISHSAESVLVNSRQLFCWVALSCSSFWLRNGSGRVVEVHCDLAASAAHGNSCLFGDAGSEEAEVGGPGWPSAGGASLVPCPGDAVTVLRACEEVNWKVWWSSEPEHDRWVEGGTATGDRRESFRGQREGVVHYKTQTQNSYSRNVFCCMQCTAFMGRGIERLKMSYLSGNFSLIRLAVLDTRPHSIRC